VAVADGATVWDPEVARVPDQPSEAVQEVALVEDHVSVEDWPAGMLAGAAESETVGGTGTGTGVVTGTGEDCAEALPAASKAETVNEYKVPAASPAIEADVPVGEATRVPSRYTL